MPIWVAYLFLCSWRPLLKTAAYVTFALLSVFAAGPVFAKKPLKADPPEAASAATIYSSYSEPFDFRGVRLGTTLDDFKHADTIKLTGALSEPVCHEAPITEQATGESPTETICRFVTRDGGSPQPSALLVAGGVAVGYDFRFYALPGTGTPRLYRINLTTKSAETLAVIDGLVARFGAATSQQTVQRLTNVGRTVEDRSFIWENKPSLIQVYMFGNLPGGSIRYELKDLANAAEAATTNARQKAAV